MLPVSDVHSIYVEECGNPNGEPIIFLHGGPGAGFGKKARRFFDPEYYHIILFDQRGCGRSIPFLELKENNIFYSVEDMEKIRLHIGIDKWTIFAGSFGTALALVYAIHYPKKVKRILCPPKNAYKIYNKILERIELEDKKQLILLALGPTATILAYDLAKEGYQAVDIGHMDIEYEWYLRKADRKIDIENKAVNEVSGVVDKEIKDKELKAIYESQIIDRISLD